MCHTTYHVQNSSVCARVWGCVCDDTLPKTHSCGVQRNHQTFKHPHTYTCIHLQTYKNLAINTISKQHKLEIQKRTFEIFIATCPQDKNLSKLDLNSVQLCAYWQSRGTKACSLSTCRHAILFPSCHSSPSRLFFFAPGSRDDQINKHCFLISKPEKGQKKKKN